MEMILGSLAKSNIPPLTATVGTIKTPWCYNRFLSLLVNSHQ